MMMSTSSSKQTQWLHRHDLVRPGIYLSRTLWNKFERAVTIDNYHRANNGKRPVSRTDVVTALIEKWSEMRQAPD